MSRPPPGRPAPRRGTSLLLVSLLGVLTAVLLIVFVLRLARSSQAKVQLGANTFHVGRNDRLQAQIEHGGPLLFQGLRGPSLDLFVQHLGTDPVHGWLAFAANRTQGSKTCSLQWRAASRHFADACDGMTFPENGLGLDQFAVTVDAKGQLFVDLQLSTGTTPRPT